MASQSQEPSRSVTSRVLVVEPDSLACASLAGTLRGAEVECDPVSGLDEALGAVQGASYDAALISLSLPGGASFELAETIRQTDSTTRVVMVGGDATADDTITAMRAGAVDILSDPGDAASVCEIVKNAVAACRRLRQQERKVTRLKKICRRLNESRKNVNDQVNVMCDDLVGAYQELADQVKKVGVVSEFQAMVRQELDIEQLLRTMLEYVLKKTGPTNAAVFLPSNHSDYSLGAYVNYDCPKDAADVLLDHLADVIPPRFQDEEGVFTFASMEELQGWIGDDAAWLVDSTTLIAPCRRNDECLAVIALFRDRSKPYDDEAIEQIASIADVFADQLARVISIHHRHMPDSSWSGWEMDDEDGSGGMAA